MPLSTGTRLVSTNGQRTIPLQIRALGEYAVRRGWTVAIQVREIGSGASAGTPREDRRGGAPSEYSPQVEEVQEFKIQITNF